jgi:hypothetical protein
MLQIRCSSKSSVEWQYILSIVLEDILGLSWRLVHDESSDVVKLTLDDNNGAIYLPNIFFRSNSHRWLENALLPKLPLPVWDSHELSEELPLIDAIIPVIFGDKYPQLLRTENSVHLPIDIFGSAFFMLSRYEEAVLEDRDNHDRFPAKSSLAYKAGFLDRPIIDEYIEILWSAMEVLWPNLLRKPVTSVMRVTCDVDMPYQVDYSYKAVCRGLVNNLVKKSSLTLAAKNFEIRWRARRGDFNGDPYLENIKWMMDVNEKKGNSVAFYFIAGRTDNFLDGRYEMKEPVIRSLLRTIHERGHEIGLHPSYHTYKNGEQTSIEANALRFALQDEAIQYEILGGRQHFLRWQTPLTARNWVQAGMKYDSTLSYAEHAGFRCGTAREFTMYDLLERKPLNLKQRPLILMESSVIADRYMGLGYKEEALSEMLKLKKRSLNVGGQFTMLWHNSHFDNFEDKMFFQELINN